MLEARVELVGYADLERMLRGWSPAAQRRISRPGVAKASRLVARIAKQNAPRQSGLLRASIGSKVRTYRSGVVAGVVGPRKGFRREVAKSKGRWTATASGVAKARAGLVARVEVRDPVKYAHLVHGGTKPHSTGKGSVLVIRSSGRPGDQSGKRHPGARARPFLRDAFQSSLPQARAIMRRSMGEQVRKEAMRLVRRKGLAA